METSLLAFHAVCLITPGRMHELSYSVFQQVNMALIITVADPVRTQQLP